MIKFHNFVYQCFSIHQMFIRLKIPIKMLCVYSLTYIYWTSIAKIINVCTLCYDTIQENDVKAAAVVNCNGHNVHHIWEESV